jgi:hypothetical protein
MGKKSEKIADLERRIKLSRIIAKKWRKRAMRREAMLKKVVKQLSALWARTQSGIPQHESGDHLYTSIMNIKDRIRENLAD